ncbi:hypothetical protein AVEN_32564-1 [Araneus ventricosus]|uniref:Uncharacterized protein n=1 Tax=Araneus ventricosus TaxID=182803 RepID=A0A4Y2C6W3_ARAVE|nr:hypothetical protein AVEN_32564-1 [Araneus ventricosus]
MPKKNPWIYRRRRKAKKKKNSGSVPEVELILRSRLSDPGDLSTSKGFISEIPLNYRVKDELSYPDTRFEHSTTLFPTEGILEDHIPSERPSETFKCSSEEELISTTVKHNKKVETSDSTKTVGPTIPDVLIIENPKTPVKVEVIDLTDDCRPAFPIMCYPVKTSYRQNRRKSNTLQVNDDAVVKAESSKKACEIITDTIGATDMNYSISEKIEQNKDSEVLAVKSHVDIYKHINTSVDNPTHFQVKTEKSMPCESFNEVNFGESRIKSPADNQIQIKAEESQSKENNTEVVTFQKSHVTVSKHADTTTRNISKRSEMDKNEENRKVTTEICNNKITGVVSSEKLITNLLNDISISPITNGGIFDCGDLQFYEQGTFRTPLLKYLNCNLKVDVHAMSHALPLLNNLIKDKEQINLIDLEDNCLATICLLPLDDNKLTETPSNLPMEAKKNSVPMFSNDFLRQILFNTKSKEKPDDIADISSPMNPSIDSAVKSNIVIDDSGFKNRLKNTQAKNMNSTSNANEKNSESTIKNPENFSKSLSMSNENGFKRTQGVLFDPPSTFSNGFKNPLKKVKISEATSLFKSGSLRAISYEEDRGTRIMDNPCYQPHHHLGKHLTSHFPSNSSDPPGPSNSERNIFTPPGVYSGFQNSLQNKQAENMTSISDAHEKNSKSSTKNPENFSKSLSMSNENSFKRTQGVLFDPPSTFSNGFKNPMKKVKISEAASLFKSGSLRTISYEEDRGTRIMDNPCYQPDHHHLGKYLTSHFHSNSSDPSPGPFNTEKNICTSPGNRQNRSLLICSDTSLQNPGYRHMVNANYLRDPRLARYGLPTFIKDRNSQKQLGSSNMSQTYLLHIVPEAKKSTVHSHVKQTPSVSTFYAARNSSRTLSPAEPFSRTSEKKTLVLLPSTTSGNSSSVTQCNPGPLVQAVKGHQTLPHFPGNPYYLYHLSKKMKLDENIEQKKLDEE